MASKSATLSAVMKSTNNDASVNELIEILFVDLTSLLYLPVFKMASKSATLSAVMKSTNYDASVNELIEILLDTTQKDQQISQLEKKRCVK